MDLIVFANSPSKSTLGQRVRLNPDCERVILRHKDVMRASTLTA
jgi:hypothetical protein